MSTDACYNFVSFAFRFKKALSSLLSSSLLIMDVLKMNAKKTFSLNKHKKNITIWSGFFVFVVFCYHLFSDGDFSFLLTFGSCIRAFAFGILIYKAMSQKSVAGLSLKTLELYALTFFFRLNSVLRFQGYLPFDSSGDWFYGLVEVMAFFLCLGCIYIVMFTFKSTYDIQKDLFGNLHVPSEFGVVYIIVPCVIFAVMFHPNLNHNWFSDVTWTIALYIESVAILPQLYMFQKQGGGTVESCLSQFVYALAFGSFLQLWFWLFSYKELAEHDAGETVGFVVIFVQIGHMLMMADFLYFYFKSMKEGGPMMLPTHGAYQA